MEQLTLVFETKELRKKFVDFMFDGSGDVAFEESLEDTVLCIEDEWDRNGDVVLIKFSVEK